MPGTNTLQMSPQRFRSGSNSMISVGSGSSTLVVEQDPHGGRAAAEDDELHPSVMHDGPIREGVGKLQCRVPLGHRRCLIGATSVNGNIRSIARTDIKRHLFFTNSRTQESRICQQSKRQAAYCDGISTRSVGRRLKNEFRGAGRQPFAYRQFNRQTVQETANAQAATSAYAGQAARASSRTSPANRDPGGLRAVLVAFRFAKVTQPSRSERRQKGRHSCRGRTAR